MNLNETIYIGIDPTSGEKDFNYAVLDSNLNQVALAGISMEEMIAFLERQTSALVAVNAPSGVNRGLVGDKRSLERSASGGTLHGANIRLSEYELRRRGIAVAGTPSRKELCPTWMQVGFSLYGELSKIEYKPYKPDGAPRQVLETHPFACYCVLAEGIPFPKPTLEGRLQRQLILNDKGLRIKDAMDFFEEITRFKLMRGILPKDILYSPEHLDVLIAAYTAWLLAHHPEDVTWVGDKEEGQIALPVRELRESYR